MARDFNDITGQTFYGWRVIALERRGGKAPSMWRAVHTCGHEHVLRVAQLKSGRRSLCPKCGERGNKVTAAAVASRIAARTPKKKAAGGTLIENIDKLREVGEKLGAVKPLPFVAIEPLVEHEGRLTRRRKVKMTPWQVGLEQARCFSHWNF